MVKLNRQLNLQRNGADRYWSRPGDRIDFLGQKDSSLWPQDPFDNDSFNQPFDANAWDPYQEMQRMQERMDAMFGEAFGRFSRSSQFGDLLDGGSFTPHIDIQDQGDSLLVTIDLPGAEEPDLEITCTEQELKISGSLDHWQEDYNDASYLRRERRSGHFSRTIALPVPVHPEQMETQFDKGVVKVTLPKETP